MTPDAAAAHVRTVLYLHHGIARLAPHEAVLLASVLDGLLRGQQTYGHLDLSTDPRQWEREGYEELRDTVIYLTAKLLQLAPHVVPDRWPGT